MITLTEKEAIAINAFISEFENIWLRIAENYLSEEEIELLENKFL